MIENAKKFRLIIAIAALAVGVMILFGDHSTHLQPPAITVGDLRIQNAWSRATPKTAKVGAGYVTIENTGSSADRLLKVESAIAGHAEVHEMKMTDGVMKMRPLSTGLEIPAGGSVTLKPGGNHIMFMKLAGPIQKDAPFKATLTFEKAGAVTLTFNTVKVGGTPDHSGHGH